jgi:putative FmdB family regulatory protein
MPNYEYECRECGKTFTEKQSFAEYDKHKKVQCPKCGSEKVEQLVGFVFTKTSKKS